MGRKSDFSSIFCDLNDFYGIHLHTLAKRGLTPPPAPVTTTTEHLPATGRSVGAKTTEDTAYVPDHPHFSRWQHT